MATGLSPLSLSALLGTSSQTIVLLHCPVDQYNNAKRRLKFHQVGRAALTAGCHPEGQVSPSSQFANLADIRKKRIKILYFFQASETLGQGLKTGTREEEHALHEHTPRSSPAHLTAELPRKRGSLPRFPILSSQHLISLSRD